MAITERLAMLVTLDAQGAIKGFENIGKAADRNLSKTDQRLDRMASGFQKAGAGMLAGAGLAAAGMYKAGQAAGNLEQAVGGTEAVFGDASGVIDEFAKKAAQAAGLSESAFRTATTSIGGQLKGLGFSVDDAAAKAVDLTQVAADLSATYGGTTAEAVAALGAAFRGEADPAERFNLFLNQNRVNAKAVALGLAETTSSVDANAKAQATLALITEQSADAQGQFAREADTAQGSMARFKAETDNLLAALGGAVAPVIADVADGLGGLVEKFNDLSPAQQDVVSKFLIISTSAIGAAGALSFTLGKVIDARDRFGALAGAMKGADGGLSKLGMATGGAALGLGIFAAAMFKAQDRADKLREAAAGLREEAASTGQTLEDVALKKLAQTFAESDRVSSSMNDLGISFRDLRDPLQGSEADFQAWRDALFASDMAMNGTDRNASELSSRVGQLRDQLGEAEQTTGRTSEAMSALGIESDAAGGEIAGATEEIDAQKEALDLAKESVDRFKEGLDAAFGPLDIEAATDKRASDLKDIADRFADAREAVAAAKQRVNDLLATPQEDRGDSFARDLAAAQEDLAEATATTSRELEGNSEAALQNREDLRQVTESIGAIIEKHREEGASLEDLKVIRELEKQGLIEQLTQLGFNQTEIGKYIEAIDAVPLTRHTVFEADTQDALSKIKGLADAIAALPASQKYSVDAAILDRNLQRASARRAIGGPVTAGTGYSTNEYLGAGKGYEWFAPANGTVMAAGSNPYGGASIDQTVNIYNPVAEEPSKSARHLRRVQLESAAY